MSQQEMYPPSQSQEGASEVPAQPYYWSTAAKTHKTSDMPKNEHPSTFEKSIPPYSYQAQETQQREQQPATHAAHASTPEQGQGAAQKQGYRPFRTGQQWQHVPWWARPQHNSRSTFRWLIFIGLALLFAKPLLFVLAHLLTGIGLLLGLVAFAILLPIIIVLILAGVFTVAALIALSALGVPIRPRVLWGQWRNYRRRRKSWR